LRRSDTKEAPEGANTVYAEMCQGAFFMASKAVGKGGFTDLQSISKIKTSLEVDFGAYVGAGESSKHLKGFPEGQPLGAGAIVLNDDVALHHSGLTNWKEAYWYYGAQTKYGHLILAGTLENFSVWAESKPCREEVEGVADSRLFAYIEHPKHFPGGRKGFIIRVSPEGDGGSSTVSNGYGRWLTAEGHTYEGNFKNGRRDGHGKYVYADGGVYEGDWKASKREGRGKHVYADGGVYEGDWKADKQEGRGKHVYADGGVYEGDWKAGQREGRGKHVYANGEVYGGDWKAGQREGRGKYVYAD